MGTIGLIAAMRLEARPLLRRVGNGRSVRLGAFRGFPFRVGTRDCLLLLSGIGLARAAEAARVLIDAASPDLLISFGVAGGVERDLRVADVVVAGSVALLDHGILTEPLPLASLSSEAEERAARVAASHASRLCRGTAVTTSGAQAITEGLHLAAHPVLEMETYGIARVAQAAHTPLISLRSLSDSADEPIPFDLEAFTDPACNLRLGRILAHALRHPGLFPRLARLQRNTARAADVAASVVFAVLAQDGSLRSEK